MTTAGLRQKFLEFFKEKGHSIIPSASLIPENDPSVLFTTAGMQPLVPYLQGQPHPMGNRLANVQKCLRTDDIEEVGDNRHLTFFEMLGNWSLGDYFKEEAIGWSFEFLTAKRWCGINPAKLFVTVFEGDADAPRDEESIGIWQARFETAGIAANVGMAGKDDPAHDAVGPRIYVYPKKKNWWPGPLSKGLCGPDTEMFYDTGRLHDLSFGAVCHPNCDCGRFVEIWNDVFMQFRRDTEGGPLSVLPAKNVDTGMGLERMAAVLQSHSSVFDTETFQVIFRAIEELSGSQYGRNEASDRSLRIIADHLRAATFAIADGAAPSNVQQGYVVRRLIRRAIREAHKIGISVPFAGRIASVVIGEFGSFYSELEVARASVIDEVEKEEAKFKETLEKGMKELERMLQAGDVTGEKAFVLYSTYGFPLELTEEIVRERGQSVDRDRFQSEFLKHQELSRTAAAGMFKGGLADTSEASTRLHTATHLLHQALRTVLGEHVGQKGSNITPERLRFDFSHATKMTAEEIKQVENLVNDAIRRDLPVAYEVMPMDKAKKAGALGFFEDKYAQVGGNINVYTVGDEKQGFFSKEICGGPHVSRTGELGTFKIQKEEAVSAGIRRIKATVTGRNDEV
ncbi:MAG TPA: alanine--tRNA ligase [Candidatus Methylomirabilis sp.]|nr:alanine--tRNA ligase [Candidatus Methylomirabilis sp.]